MFPEARETGSFVRSLSVSCDLKAHVQACLEEL